MDRDDDMGPESDGVIAFEGKSPYEVCAVNTSSRKVVVCLRSYTEKARDERMKPVVEGLPGIAKCVSIAREWLPKVGVDEKDLYFPIEGLDKPLYVFKWYRVGYYDEILEKQVHENFAADISFVQQIGGLPADWNGFAGRVSIKLADGGKFAVARHCLRDWEVIGHQPVLDKDEIIAALKEGFWWSYDPIRYKEARVRRVELRAFHHYDDTPQTSFPLVYLITIGPSDNENRDLETIIRMPALRSQRNGYGLLSKARRGVKEKKIPENGDP